MRCTITLFTRVDLPVGEYRSCTPNHCSSILQSLVGRLGFRKSWCLEARIVSVSVWLPDFLTLLGLPLGASTRTDREHGMLIFEGIARSGRYDMGRHDLSEDPRICYAEPERSVQYVVWGIEAFGMHTIS